MQAHLQAVKDSQKPSQAVPSLDTVVTRFTIEINTGESRNIYFFADCRLTTQNPLSVCDVLREHHYDSRFKPRRNLALCPCCRSGNNDEMRPFYSYQVQHFRQIPADGALARWTHCFYPRRCSKLD